MKESIDKKPAERAAALIASLGSLCSTQTQEDVIKMCHAAGVVDQLIPHRRPVVRNPHTHKWKVKRMSHDTNIGDFTHKPPVRRKYNG